MGCVRAEYQQTPGGPQHVGPIGRIEAQCEEFLIRLNDRYSFVGFLKREGNEVAEAGTPDNQIIDVRQRQCGQGSRRAVGRRYTRPSPDSIRACNSASVKYVLPVMTISPTR